MAAKRVTHGDMVKLLEIEGFSATPAPDDQIMFQKPSAGAALALRAERPNNAATGTALELLRYTMVNFGIMTQEEFDRWIAYPKRFQAA
jgi:hypothetical protein